MRSFLTQVLLLFFFCPVLDHETLGYRPDAKVYEISYRETFAHQNSNSLPHCLELEGDSNISIIYSTQFNRQEIRKLNPWVFSKHIL